jgi:hypothetical protein
MFVRSISLLGMMTIVGTVYGADVVPDKNAALHFLASINGGIKVSQRAMFVMKYYDQFKSGVGCTAPRDRTVGRGSIEASIGAQRELFWVTASLENGVCEINIEI